MTEFRLDSDVARTAGKFGAAIAIGGTAVLGIAMDQITTADINACAAVLGDEQTTMTITHQPGKERVIKPDTYEPCVADANLSTQFFRITPNGQPTLEAAAQSPRPESDIKSYKFNMPTKKEFLAKNNKEDTVIESRNDKWKNAVGISGATGLLVGLGLYLCKVEAKQEEADKKAKGSGQNGDPAAA